MLRSLLGLPSVVADYTLGTVIVFVQLTFQARAEVAEARLVRAGTDRLARRALGA